MFLIFNILLILSSFVASQSNPTVVCVPGQCLQGFSNTTIGAILSAPGAATSLVLLPGQYTSTTNPQLLHDLLTSPSASISPSPGFGNPSLSPLPLKLELEPGLSIYSQSLYSGQSGFTRVPSVSNTNTSTPLSANSLSISSNVWISVNLGSNNRVVLWDSVPDVNQLPRVASSSLSLLDVQDSSCSPPCASSGVCSASGTCTCAPGFTGSSCESCASGFFGSTCQPCPAGCASCDEGISGTGRCLKPTISNAPSTCNCLNGVCGSNGQCTCNAGWTTADNGTACAKCSPGFFLTSTGDCKICQLGCAQCADGTGACIACKSGFSQDANDRTKCNPVSSVTSTGTVCPDGSFSSGNTCSPCSPSCQTCSAGTSNDCTLCASGKFSFNGACVGANADGVCQGSSLIADNNKHECDTCGAKCTTCKISNFNVASTIDKLECTGCLPGFFLSGGKCVDSCPSGSFVSQDNLTCTACDPACSACSGSSTFCLTCSGNQLASNGKCVSSCPSNTFSSSGSCISCHPDCASCSGSSFNQCTSCPPNRPVLSNGRCLPTCSKSQFFDTTSSSCQACDSSCSSCSGSGPNNCLACSSSTQVLRGGSCVAANCNGTSNVIPGLGVCLSELVVVPRASGTGTPAPLPTISGITSPTITSTRRPLEWWEILLMALGCAFIFLVIVWLWRRRARKQRAKQTAIFAATRLNRPHDGGGWRWRLVRFGEKFFGHNKSQRVVISAPLRAEEETESMKLNRLRAAEEGHERDVDKLITTYDYPRPAHDTSRRARDSFVSAPSIYSQMTGIPPRVPDPRQPVKQDSYPNRSHR